MKSWETFPTWREKWDTLEGVSQLLTDADTMLRRRRAGNMRTPLPTLVQQEPAFANSLLALRTWANGTPPRNKKDHPVIIGIIHNAIDPVLQANNWPRWLLLENAFLDASETGDLLFAAIVLRTMCEEVQRLHVLDIQIDELVCLAKSNLPDDYKRLELFVAVAHTSFDTLGHEMVVDGKNWPKLKTITKLMPELETARARLNSYVHPNYGSHIVALYPERASAAHILLEAIICVYDAFFSLSWSEKPIGMPSRPVGRMPVGSWQQSARQLISKKLPQAKQATDEQTISEILNSPALTEWLTLEGDYFGEILNSAEFEQLLRDLPRVSGYKGQTDFPLGYLTWAGARPSDLVTLLLARRDEQLLAARFSSGAPQSANQSGWLLFNAMSLKLAVQLDQTKAAAFRAQLVRQIARDNPIGIWLSVRSLIEHRALIVWLTSQIQKSLDKNTSNLDTTISLPDSFSEVSQPIANFLASQAKKSNEPRRAWVTEELGGTRTAWLNLENVMNASFPEGDAFNSLYAIASAVLHGRHLRSWELMQNLPAIKQHANLCGLLVLERLCDKSEEMDHLSEAIKLDLQLEHAADQGGIQNAQSITMARQILGDLDAPLKPEIDYSGDGSATNPFIIKPHLQLQLATRRLILQMGCDPAERNVTFEFNLAGVLCTRWSYAQRDLWFRIPL